MAEVSELPSIIEDLNSKKDNIKDILEKSGVPTDGPLVKHYDDMFGVASATALMAYVYSDSFKGSSTDAEIIMLEAFKSLNIPGLKGYEGAIDSGITKWQAALDFFGNGKGNKAAVGGVLWGLSIFSESINKIREREYGQSPALDAWHDSLAKVGDYIDSALASMGTVYSEAKKDAENFAGTFASSQIDGLLRNRIDELISGVPEGKNSFGLTVESSGLEISRESVHDQNAAFSQVSNGLIRFCTKSTVVSTAACKPA